jgi:hypothetical protein
MPAICHNIDHANETTIDDITKLTLANDELKLSFEKSTTMAQVPEKVLAWLYRVLHVGNGRFGL